MACEHFTDRLSEYLEKTLPAEELRQVDAHIRECPECRELLDLMREAEAALSGLPELEVPTTLLKRLHNIPGRKRRPRLNLDFLIKPSLQPALAAATIFLTLFSFYAFNPQRGRINKAIDLRWHQGISRIERIVAGAESFTHTLAGFRDDILVSLRNLVGADQGMSE